MTSSMTSIRAIMAMGMMATLVMEAMTRGMEGNMTTGIMARELCPREIRTAQLQVRVAEEGDCP